MSDLDELLDRIHRHADADTLRKSAAERGGGSISYPFLAGLATSTLDLIRIEIEVWRKRQPDAPELAVR